MSLEIHKDVQNEFEHVWMRRVVVRAAGVKRKVGLRVIAGNPVADAIQPAHFRLHPQLFSAARVLVIERIVEAQKSDSKG